MVNRNDGPLTTLAFNYLPATDDILCVYDHGGIFSDPNVPNEHLVLVHFYIIPSNDPQLKRTLYPKTLDIEVPLSDLLYFGCGSWFKDQVHRGRSKLHKKSIFSNLKTSSVLDAFVDGPNLKIYSERSFEMEGTLSELKGGLYLKSAKGNKPVFKDVIEGIRFYFSGMNKFASEFLRQMAGD